MVWECWYFFRSLCSIIFYIEDGTVCFNDRNSSIDVSSLCNDVYYKKIEISQEQEVFMNNPISDLYVKFMETIEPL